MTPHPEVACLVVANKMEQVLPRPGKGACWRYMGALVGVQGKVAHMVVANKLDQVRPGAARGAGGGGLTHEACECCLLQYVWHNLRWWPAEWVKLRVVGGGCLGACMGRPAQGGLGASSEGSQGGRAAGEALSASARGQLTPAELIALASGLKPSGWRCDAVAQHQHLLSLIPTHFDYQSDATAAAVLCAPAVFCCSMTGER